MKFRTLLQFFVFLLIALSAKAQLTGEWTDENGVCYKIRQIENQVFWYMDGRPRVINVFMGYLAGNTITGTWADVPGGNIQGSGTLALRVENQNRMVKIDQNGNYGGSVWTRGSCSNTASNPPGSGTFAGSVFTGQAKSSKSGTVWPSVLKIVSYDQASGRVEGEIEWPSLNAVHKITGQLTGSKFTFTEVDYIKKGGATLNSEYTSTFLNGEISGTWKDPNSDYGTFVLNKK